MTPRELFASRAHASIAPEHPVELGAGNNAAGEFGIHDDIEVNALAIWLDAEPPVVLFSFDLLYPGRAVRAAVAASLPGIPAANVLVAATHTHAAPMTDDAKPALGAPDADYLRALTSTTRAVASALLEPGNRVPVRLEVGTATASHAVNRRRTLPLCYTGGRWQRNAVIVAPNPKGPTDDTVAIAALRDSHGELFAVLWNSACHPVGFPAPRTVSAHFPGTVRGRIRERTGPDLAVLYFQGFSGDLRPKLRMHPTTSKDRLKRVLFGTRTGAFRAAELREWSERLAEVVLDHLDGGCAIAVPEILAVRDAVPGERFAGPTDLEVGFQLIRFGREFAIVAMSAEPVHEYGAYVRARMPNTVTMCAGCVDVPIGYIPTARMLREGGYEAGDFCASFALDWVSANVEEATKEGFDRLIDRALGRQ